MHDPMTFEARVQVAYDRWAGEIPTDVDSLALVRATRARTSRARPAWLATRSLRLALLLGVLVALALAAAVLVGGQPAPAPRGVTNGWIAFAANRNDLPSDGAGEFRDIYLTGEGTSARRIIGSAGDGRSQGCPRFSPDGSRLAYGEGDDTDRSGGSRDGRGRWPITNRAAVLVEVDVGGQPSPPLLRVSLPTAPGPLPCPEWSPDGSQLAFFTGTEVWVADVVTGALTTFPVDPTETGYPGFTTLDLEWAPDGSSIAVAEGARIRVIPLAGTEPTVFPGLLRSSLGWMAGGEQLIYVRQADDPQIRVIDLDTRIDRLLRARAAGVVVSPDGSRLAYPVENSGLVIMDADGSNEVFLPVDPGFGGLQWSPDGRHLLWVLASVAVTPGSPTVTYPSLDLSFEWMGIEHVSWQAVQPR